MKVFSEFVSIRYEFAETFMLVANGLLHSLSQLR